MVEGGGRGSNGMVAGVVVMVVVGSSGVLAVVNCVAVRKAGGARGRQCGGRYDVVGVVEGKRMCPCRRNFDLRLLLVSQPLYSLLVIL